jgi:SAM-dependent methyltransferase
MSSRHEIKVYSQRFRNENTAKLYATRFERGSRKRIDKREQRAVRRIFASLPECRSVLDVPSGAGRFAATLGQGGRHVLEMDVAFEILQYARDRSARAGLHAVAMQGDASRLPLAENAVDCVFSNRLLHHLLKAEERQVILREFHRVCRKWTVVSFFNYKGLARIRSLLKRLKGRKPAYDQQPTLEEFTAEVTRAGFTVKSVVSTGMPWVSQKYFVLEKA